jgi:NADP-dependent 3-hydroxy acid dehydrogenase YdfG
MTHAMAQATRTHLVTGAGSGIGEVIADRLHQRGDRLVLLARSGDRADHLADRFPGCATVVADLADHEALVDLGGPDALDTLVHAAGVVDLAPVAEVDWHHWRQQLDVNLTAPAMLTQALLPALRAARGTVVFVNSGAGLNAHAAWSAYAASKHGLKALADALRHEEHANGVRVTSVYPGRTASPMQAKVHQQEGKQYDPSRWIDPESVATTVLMCLDLPRDAEVNDVTVRPGR